jgi:cytochrome o ubiquinol oxidase subunit II
MKQKYKIGLVAAVVLLIISAAIVYLHGQNIAVLNPKGTIALKQRNLIYTVLGLSLLIVIPVFAATVFISVRYREGNKKKVTYSPDWDHSRKLEVLWWLFPSCLIAVLSVITWRSTQALAPNRPLISSTPTMTIQVVALDWKWLFIYPKQGIASVNYVALPEHTPVDFQITADAPMNSFWIPQLGGQIYAMAGMMTNLNLMATTTGDFPGSSANISGLGFASMSFMAHAGTAADFNNWVTSVKDGNGDLNLDNYTTLAEPSQNNPNSTYSSVQPGLLEDVLLKYMTPETASVSGGSTTAPQTTSHTQMMDME